MKSIIQQAFDKKYGYKPLSEPRLVMWEHNLEVFTDAWNACVDWHAEMEAREKDDKEEKKDLEQLYKGDF